MESKETVKVLGFLASPISPRVEWALMLKSVEYEYIEEDILNKSPLLLELNPVHKKVPVLVHGQKVVLESLLILEYIDEIWKQFPLLPQDPHERAMVRFWAKLGDEKLIKNAYMAMICSEGGDLEDEKERALKSAIEALEKVEGELKGKNKFFGGETIGYLDLVFGWISYWIPIWEEIGSMDIVNPIQFPATTAWMENFRSHPVIKDKLPPREKMVVYFQWRKKETSARLASAKKD